MRTFTTGHSSQLSKASQSFDRISIGIQVATLLVWFLVSHALNLQKIVGVHMWIIHAMFVMLCIFHGMREFQHPTHDREDQEQTLNDTLEQKALNISGLTISLALVLHGLYGRESKRISHNIKNLMPVLATSCLLSLASNVVMHIHDSTHLRYQRDIKIGMHNISVALMAIVLLDSIF